MAKLKYHFQHIFLQVTLLIKISVIFTFVKNNIYIRIISDNVLNYTWPQLYEFHFIFFNYYYSLKINLLLMSIKH